jgi:hypothetical protein
MRALLLLVLGGGLLWFLIRGIGSTRAEEPQPSSNAGFLIPAPESSPPQSAPANESAATSEPTPRSESLPKPSESPERSSKAVEATASTRAVPQAPPSNAAESEPAIAAQLLHRTRDAADLIRSSTALPAERRDLALAFIAALQGDLAEAKRLQAAIADKPTVSAAERELLSRLVEHASNTPMLASVSHESPLAQAATMAALAREGGEALHQGHSRDAARVFSDLLLEEIRAPWRADRTTISAWVDSLRRAQDGYRWNRLVERPAAQVTVDKGDSLISIRKRVLKEHPEALVCTGLIERANGLRGTVHPGQVLRVPLERPHMLVALDAHWAFFMFGEEIANAWEIGVGKTGNETRPGTYVVGDKTTEPMWFRPGHEPVPFGDPENPLGTRWIAWRSSDGSATGLGFHGTKEPESVGKDLSQGCVRMLNRDVEELYEILPKDAAIVVQP